MSIVLALLIFSGIVLFHEWGHFLLAKRGGIEVIEFSLGMGPRICSFVKGGTRYSLKVLPFGGSCQMKGEDMNDMSDGAFASKGVLTRISVIAAGPIWNFLLAYVMAVILIACVGANLPTILIVQEGYPAAQAGLEAGDQIVSLDGHRMHTYSDVSSYVENNQARMSSGVPMEVIYTRGGERLSTSLTPVDNGNGRYVLGITGSTAYRTAVGPAGCLQYGVYEVAYWIKAVFQGLQMMLTGGVSMDDVSGPVGVVSVIDETYQESKSDGAYYIFLNMLNIAILLSANLGVMNLLPLPALDGGRLLFLLIELIRRKRVNPEIEGRIHLAGLLGLLVLMAVVMVSDIQKLIIR